MFAAQELHKAYKGAPVLDGVDFTLAEHETLAIVGPSGCGKTTLLYSLCGLVPPDAGRVSLDGEPVLGPRQDISIILQDFGLLPWRTVADNVALGLKIRGLGKRERRQRARTALADLGILGREQDYPGNLSGGEQQRVAIARAFVTDPRLLLMDEPFSSLDALTREKLQQTLLTVWTKARVPYVLVTHSLEEAAYLGRKILILSGRPAKPVACFDNPDFGDPELRRMESYFQLLRNLRQTVEASW